MTRHGTRFPSEVDLPAMKATSNLKDEIIKNYIDGKGEMCAQVYISILYKLPVHFFLLYKYQIKYLKVVSEYRD